MPARPRLAYADHRVTAVVVAHDGARWLPDTLDALTAQTRPPQFVVGVDTHSTDESRALLADVIGDELVTDAPRAAGFGEAVATGLAHLATLVEAAPPERAPRRRSPAESGPTPAPIPWVWLLHDDSAPLPDALERLLAAVQDAPSIAIAGPKLVDWDDPRVLVEIGLTVDHAGRRETGLERRELDQGQHDQPHDVLAVGTAGALIRRDVWDALGGLDRRWPLFRDEIDLGWRVNAAGHRVHVVPSARVRHARAAATGRRPADATPGRVTGVDRRHALEVLFANVSLPGLLLLVPRLVVGVVLRTLGFLLTRQVGQARDEVGALLRVLLSPLALIRARKARRGTRKVPARALHHLFAGRAARLRGYVEAAGDWLSGGGRGQASGDLLDAPVEPERGVDEAIAGLDLGDGAPRRVLRSHPGLALFLALLVVSLLAERGLIGGGRLIGGDLLPAPTGASDLWRDYFAAWHPGAWGTSGGAPPGIAVLAVLSSLLLGKAWLAVDVILLGAVPLAGLSAFVAARRAVPSPGIRAWGAAAYALLPVATGGIANGRLDVAVALVATPPLLASGYRLITADPRYSGWRRAFATGFGLALATALAPQLWLIFAVLAGIGALVALLTATPASRAGALRRILAAGIAIGTPLAVLVPWSGRLLSDADVVLLGNHPGLPAPTGPTARAVDLLALRAGGSGTPTIWLTCGLLLAAAALLTYRGATRRALGLWSVVVVALAFALVVARGDFGLRPGSPGVALVVASAAVVLLAIGAAEGLRERVARYSFGWRQPVAAAIGAAALLVPFAAAVGWVARGAARPLDRRPVQTLPAAAVADLRRSPGSRVLWLAPQPGGIGAVRYDLSTASGPGLLDVDRRAPADARRLVDRLVADVTSARGTEAADGLTSFAVRYVAVRTPVDPTLAAALDSQQGLSRAQIEGDLQLWRTLTLARRATLLGPELASRARAGRFLDRDLVRRVAPVALAARLEGIDVTVPPGPVGRLIVLSEDYSGAWRATFDGVRAAPVPAYVWAQAFEVPAEGGRFSLRRAQSPRTRALTVEAALLGLVLILAAPGVRRPDEFEHPTPDHDEDADQPAGDPVGAGVAS